MTRQIADIRRLTGANFLLPGCGAACEVTIPDSAKGVAIALWRQHARALLDAVGWQEQKVAARAFPGGCSIAISAPIDALYAATDILERSWLDTCDFLQDATPPDIAGAARTLLAKVTAEQDPTLAALWHAARAHDVTFLGHDGNVSLGLGTGCAVWPEDALPTAEHIDWAALHDVPVAMVTGTNGKSTTVRLTAAIAAAAGLTVGISTSDWVRVGTEIIDKGDYSGPAGARLALRDPRTELAVIETARGGLMRRGLPISRANACLITNIAADHLGDYGITDVPTLADAKFLLSCAVVNGGHLVLNGDDPALVSRSAGYSGRLSWYGLSPDGAALKSWISSGGHAAYVDNGVMMLAMSGNIYRVLPVSEFSPALGGAADFNVSNALGAIALAAALDLPVAAMTKALRDFENTPEQNPGRGNFLEFGGIKILIDFAHNPHGVAALARSVAKISAKRRLIVLGQAGDRSDDDTRDMTRAAWQANPDMVVVKELTSKMRGRKPGEVPAVIVDELQALGASKKNITVTKNENDAVRKSLEWAREGDFLVLLLHEDRAPAMALLDRLRQENWHAGDPVLA